MIIVSQDKCSVLNFESLEGLTTGKNKGEEVTQVAGLKNDNYLMLGAYATEERAKEVLLEIVDRAEGWEDLKAGQPDGIAKYVYEMPKE